MTCRSPLVVIGILSVALCLSAQQFSSPATHTVKPTPKTVAWGYYDAKTPPVLRIKSGDTAEMRTRITSSSQPGVSFITDGGVPGGPCLRLQGLLSAADFFAGLKRTDGPDGAEYRRGGARVTRYPGELQLNFQVRDFPCPENIASGGPRKYLTREWVKGLRIAFYWKRGLQTRAINDVREKTVSAERIEPLDALDARSLPERFVWKFHCVVPGDGVSLAEHLVIVVRAPGGRIVARVAARF